MLECLNISILVGKSLCPEFASAHHLLAPAQKLKETNNQRVNAWHIRGPRHILRVNSQYLRCIVRHFEYRPHPFYR